MAQEKNIDAKPFHLKNQSELDEIYSEIKQAYEAMQKAVDRLHKWEPIFDFPENRKLTSYENHSTIQG